MVIKESAQSYSYAIKSTKEYNDLIQAKRKIENKTYLKKEVIDFNKKLSNIYSSNKSQMAIKSDVEQLFREFNKLHENEEVKDFLKASNTFNQMMYKTNLYINEIIQKDLSLK